jgi:hypothetical protein
MNQGTNQGDKSGKYTYGNLRKPAENGEKERNAIKKKTKIEEYSKSVNRLPLTTYCQVF